MERVIFALAQYTPDLLRQEPRNIGVFVAGDNRILGRFLGEDEAGVVRIAGIPSEIFNDVDLYLDWHDHWTGLLCSGWEQGDARTFLLERLIRNKGKAFAVVHGGEYDSDQEQSLEEIASHLFARLVLPERVERVSGTAASGELTGGYLGRRLVTEFRKIGILETSSSSENLFVRHPVRPRVPVQGLNPVPHTADFYQENGHRYVMEHVDFSIQTLVRARDHAMLSHYILADVVQAAQTDAAELPPLHPIAIVNRVASNANMVQDYALAALASVPRIQIVYWDRDEERKQFLDERRAIAEVTGLHGGGFR